VVIDPFQVDLWSRTHHWGTSTPAHDSGCSTVVLNSTKWCDKCSINFSRFRRRNII